MAQNRPLWRLLVASGAMHSQWCKPEMMNDDYVVSEIRGKSKLAATSDSYVCLEELLRNTAMHNVGVCVGSSVKVGFHYPSSWPEFTGRVDGPRTRAGAYLEGGQTGAPP